MRLDPDRPHFDLATFTNVYDTTPCRDRVSLRQLVTALVTFEVKLAELPRQRREEARLAAAVLAVREGRTLPGSRHFAALHKASGSESALQDAIDKLRKTGSDNAKKALRLWAPAGYRPGARRGTDGVAHTSCLVLDYDAGVTLAQATDTWRGWFHVVHSTWSHRPDRPRFRVILPLLQAVPAAQWETVWMWAWERSGHGIDPACKGRGGTFALPALLTPDRPHLRRVAHGALLDPMAEGLVTEHAIPMEAPPEPETPYPFRRLDRDKRYLATAPTDAELDTTPWDVESAFDMF